MRLRLMPCRSATAVIEARGCDASSRIATFSSIVQRRRRATVLMISTRLSITVLMTGHKDAKTHDSPSAPQGSRQTTLTENLARRSLMLGRREVGLAWDDSNNNRAFLSGTISECHAQRCFHLHRIAVQARSV